MKESVKFFGREGLVSFVRPGHGTLRESLSPRVDEGFVRTRREIREPLQGEKEDRGPRQTVGPAYKARTVPESCATRCLLGRRCCDRGLLCRKAKFDLLAVSYPILGASLDTLLAAVRQGRASSGPRVMLLVAEKDKGYLDRYAGEDILWFPATSSDDELEEVVSRFVEELERATVRVPGSTRGANPL